MRIGIMGLGEVGTAIHKLYESKIKAYEIFTMDLDLDNIKNSVNILNVCIGWSDSFIDTVVSKARLSNYVVIHSTVPVGTCEEIEKLSRKPVVHSPIRGIHPHLFKGVITFEKYFGSASADHMIATYIAGHFASMGVKTKVLSNSRTTELGKLLDTTYYGICIAWHAHMKEICDHFGEDFEESVTLFNKTYNEGYASLGMNNVIRPVLYPPKGTIGGHCIIPNAELLDKDFNSDFIKALLKLKKEK